MVLVRQIGYIRFNLPGVTFKSITFDSLINATCVIEALDLLHAFHIVNNILIKVKVKEASNSLASVTFTSVS